MELYVIRHGESETNKSGLNCGWGDSPLTRSGCEQAENCKKLISHIKFDIVYASDLLRAKQTAEIVLPGYPYHFSCKLREINVGKLAFKSNAECLEKYGQLYLDAKEKQDFRCFEGESLDEMMDRVVSFMHELECLENINNVAVVAHEGSLQCMLRYVLGSNIAKKSAKLDNASVSRFTYKDNQWQLNTWNYRGTI